MKNNSRKLSVTQLKSVTGGTVFRVNVETDEAKIVYKHYDLRPGVTYI